MTPDEADVEARHPFEIIREQIWPIYAQLLGKPTAALSPTAVLTSR